MSTLIDSIYFPDCAQTMNSCLGTEKLSKANQSISQLFDFLDRQVFTHNKWIAKENVEETEQFEKQMIWTGKWENVFGSLRGKLNLENYLYGEKEAKKISSCLKLCLWTLDAPTVQSFCNQK